MRRVRLGCQPVAVDDIVAIADGRAEPDVTPDLLERLTQARQALDRAARGGQRIYGLNTGLGAKVGLDLKDDPAAFQRQLVRGRAVGVGPPMRQRAVRAIMAARLAMLARGGSGISPHVFQALAAMLAARVHPLVPSRGSLGEGDLCLLSYLALALLGEGAAEHDGVVLPADQALDRAGLVPVELGPKDGLSLINASAVSVGTGALVVVDATRLLRWQESAAMLGFAAMRANRQVLDPRIQAARPALGQVDAGYRLVRLLEGSDHEPAGLQDALSFRCLAPVIGALDDAVRHAGSVTELELNAAADNPLVLSATDEVISTGNFATPAFALTFENLGLAIAQAAQTTAARIVHLSNGGRAGLPRALSQPGGTAAGFVPRQKTVMALLADVRRHAAPVMLDVWAVSEGVEDHGTQSPLVVEKAAAMLDAWRQLVAIELLAAAQAADLQPAVRLDGALGRLHRAVRGRVSFVVDDRPLGIDATTLHDWIAAQAPPEG